MKTIVKFDSPEDNKTFLTFDEIKNAIGIYDVYYNDWDQNKIDGCFYLVLDNKKDTPAHIAVYQNNIQIADQLDWKNHLFTKSDCKINITLSN
jgi:hypothetical protein